ncbi:hypothetical protein CTAM01_10841 [Colletotrichum tamarilloi]|uniref:Uncharacterized protein n=1 Tax=Colletotrichum tamarilloi TaxID=1209934 RepID=A0ABQ9QZA6_9PEZI|nr:uncharacterized protein CTAM01_10841 [Colletotrichum tamarilloi]KAK1490172.1 hypothetical protein CTAM01_10841 [Colletotrichum tamarilloi]
MDPSTESADQGIANIIWANLAGETASSTHRSRSVKLSEYYANRLQSGRPRCDDAEVRRAIKQFKSDPLTTKRSILIDHGGIEVVLDCTVRLMFMTACQVESTALGSYYTHEWKEDQSLVAFLGRVYRQVFAGGVPEQPISTTNLSAHILSKKAGIEIRSADTMSDHLCLIQGVGYKTLLVFNHRTFLEHSIEALKADRKDLSHSFSEAVSLGCLHPKLLEETLRTLDLLFPTFNDRRSRRILEKWVQRENLDPAILEPCDHLLDISTKCETPEDLHALYTEYPHWAPRLACLLKEVDDPTPTTRWERYADERKSPRHMYKCALAAFIVAAIFGILATVLAAVQVWISYCDWVNDPERPLCKVKKT